MDSCDVRANRKGPQMTCFASNCKGTTSDGCPCSSAEVSFVLRSPCFLGSARPLACVAVTSLTFVLVRVSSHVRFASPFCNALSTRLCGRRASAFRRRLGFPEYADSPFAAWPAKSPTKPLAQVCFGPVLSCVIRFLSVCWWPAIDCRCLCQTAVAVRAQLRAATPGRVKALARDLAST